MALYRVAAVLRRVAQVVEQVGAAGEQAEGQRRQAGASQHAGLAEGAGGGRRAEHQQVLGPLPEPDSAQPDPRPWTGESHGRDRQPPPRGRGLNCPAPPPVRARAAWALSTVRPPHDVSAAGRERLPNGHEISLNAPPRREDAGGAGRTLHQHLAAPSRMSAHATTRVPRPRRPLPPRLTPVRRARRVAAIVLMFCTVPVADLLRRRPQRARRTRASRSTPSSGSGVTARPRSPPRSRASTTRSTHPPPGGPALKRLKLHTDVVAAIHPPDVAPIIHPALPGEGVWDADRDLERGQSASPDRPVPQRSQLPTDGGRRGLDRPEADLNRPLSRDSSSPRSTCRGARWRCRARCAPGCWRPSTAASSSPTPAGGFALGGHDVLPAAARDGHVRPLQRRPRRHRVLDAAARRCPRASTSRARTCR